MQLSPFQRILVTANGNLQRIVSSWCNEAVTVRVVRNELVATMDRIRRYDREVDLVCRNAVFCVAKSTVTLTDRVLIEAVASNAIGLGQLFRTFDLLPQFDLKCIHPPLEQNGDFSRMYILSAKGITCEIEEFFSGVQVARLGANDGRLRSDNLETSDDRNTGSRKQSNYGDIMSGTTVQTTVDDSEYSFTPFQRVLITANGNIQRLVSSYFNTAVDVVVGITKRTGFGTYERVVELKCHDKTFCVAKSEIVVKDRKLCILIDQGKMESGEIFHKYRPGGTLPHFTLCQAHRKQSNDITRTYILSTDFASVTIDEEFSSWLFHEPSIL